LLLDVNKFDLKCTAKPDPGLPSFQFYSLKAMKQCYFSYGF